jgi:hypothetical protein
MRLPPDIDPDYVLRDRPEPDPRFWRALALSLVFLDLFYIGLVWVPMLWR